MIELEEALHCPTCGYNLTGLRENRCPECGTEFSLEDLRRQIAEDATGIPLTTLFIRLFSSPALAWLSVLVHALPGSSVPFGNLYAMAALAAFVVGVYHSVRLALDLSDCSKHRLIMFLWLLIAIPHLMIAIAAVPIAVVFVLIR